MDGIDPKLFLKDDFYLSEIEIGDWSEKKHEKIFHYASMFATGMKKKWDSRVFIDLFAGPGKWKAKGSDSILPGSPLLALSVPDPFDRYLFCEYDEDFLSSLKSRVNLLFPGKDISYIEGDSNKNSAEILSKIPMHSRTNKVLSLCFVDPYKAGNLKFSTIKAISEKFVDFMILIPSGMDILRNQHNYSRADNTTLDDFLGSDLWRTEWATGASQFKNFGLFIADFFGRQMSTLGFIYEGLHSYEAMKLKGDRGVLLYHLAFFSKNSRGVEFWNKTKEGTESQLVMNF